MRRNHASENSERSGEASTRISSNGQQRAKRSLGLKEAGKGSNSPDFEQGSISRTCMNPPARRCNPRLAITSASRARLLGIWGKWKLGLLGYSMSYRVTESGRLQVISWQVCLVKD